MATTGVVNTKLFRLRFISPSGTPVAITCQLDATFTVTTATRTITCKDSGQWEEVLPGQTSWEVSGTAFFDYGATTSAEDVYDAAIAQAVCKLAVGTTVTGDVSWTGDAYCTQWEVQSSGTNENTQWSCAFKGTGAITKVTNS